MHELYKKYRPGDLRHVRGQADAVRVLQEMIEHNRIPHALLLTGDSGVGKTTLARILQKELDCGDSDFTELNCGDFRGIDMVRDIRRDMGLAPMCGKCRIWLIDEVHGLTKDAMEAMLKILEDTPKHVYFILATTNPTKLLKTIRTRCTTIKLEPLNPATLTELLTYVLGKEDVSLSDAVIERIVEVADGSARQALVILDKIIGLDDEKEQLNAVQSSDIKHVAEHIARMLMDKRKAWPEVGRALRDVAEDPETLRYMILGYASAVLYNAANSRAYQIIVAFESNFYDSKKAGLIRACYEVINSK